MKKRYPKIGEYILVDTDLYFISDEFVNQSIGEQKYKVVQHCLPKRCVIVAWSLHVDPRDYMWLAKHKIWVPIT